LAQAVPSLANGGISKDGRTITYHLRRNVRWHDGAPFTSRDVAFSFAAIMNPGNNVANRHGYDQIAKVETPGPYTVVVRLKRPYAPGSRPCSRRRTQPDPPRASAGTGGKSEPLAVQRRAGRDGPYKFLRWDHGASIELIANDDYYLGKPKLARLSVRIVPTRRR